MRSCREWPKDFPATARHHNAVITYSFFVSGHGCRYSENLKMELALFTVTGVALAVAIWLNILATFVVRYDHTLEAFQKVAQIVIAWAVPFIGSAFVLHLIWEQYPEAIPKSWIPWPFKQMIFGEAPPPNQERDNYEGPGIEGSHNFGRHTQGDSQFGGGDGGGGAD